MASRRLDRYLLNPLFGPILDRWIMLQMLLALLMCVAVVLCIYVVIDFLTTSDSFANRLESINAAKAQGEAPDTMVELAARYYVLNLPGLLYLFGPMIVLMATLFTVARMMRAREFAVATTSGVSVQRMLRGILLVVAGCCVLMLAYNEWLLPLVRERIDSENLFEQRRDRFNGTLTDTDNRLVWLQNFDTRLNRADYGLVVVYGDATLPDDTPTDLRLPVLERSEARGDAAGRLQVEVIETAGVEVRPGGQWYADYANRRRPTEADFHGETFRRLAVVERLGTLDATRDPGAIDTAPQTHPLVNGDPVSAPRGSPLLATPINVQPLPTSLRPADIGQRKQRVLARLSITELFAMAARDPHAEEPAVQLHASFLYPLAPLILCLIGMSLMLDTENQNALRGLAIGLGLCMAFFGMFIALQGIGLRGEFSSLIEGAIGERNAATTQVGVAVALWGGNLAFLVYGARRFLRMRT